MAIWSLSLNMLIMSAVFLATGVCGWSWSCAATTPSRISTTKVSNLTVVVDHVQYLYLLACLPSGIQWPVACYIILWFYHATLYFGCILLDVTLPYAVIPSLRDVPWIYSTRLVDRYGIHYFKTFQIESLHPESWSLLLCLPRRGAAHDLPSSWSDFVLNGLIFFFWNDSDVSVLPVEGW